MKIWVCLSSTLNLEIYVRISAPPFSLIVSYGLHTSFINSLVQKKHKNIHANPIKSLRFGLCHTFTPRPWKHGFAFTPQAWRYDTNQTLSIKIQLKRMIYLQQELGRAWVCLPLGISLGLCPREIPRGRQTQALPRSCRRYIPCLIYRCSTSIWLKFCWLFLESNYSN